MWAIFEKSGGADWLMLNFSHFCGACVKRRSKYKRKKLENKSIKLVIVGFCFPMETDFPSCFLFFCARCESLKHSFRLDV